VRHASAVSASARSRDRDGEACSVVGFWVTGTIPAVTGGGKRRRSAASPIDERLPDCCCRRDELRRMLGAIADEIGCGELAIFGDDIGVALATRSIAVLRAASAALCAAAPHPPGPALAAIASARAQLGTTSGSLAG